MMHHNRGQLQQAGRRLAAARCVICVSPDPAGRLNGPASAPSAEDDGPAAFLIITFGFLHDAQNLTADTGSIRS